MLIATNLPNILTICRMLLVPVTVWALIHDEYAFAFGAFAVAGITDALDGYLARRFHSHSELGAYLDPLADKAMMVSVYVTLSVMGLLPDWLAIVVVTRDVLIVAAVLLARYRNRPVVIRPVLVSKVNTFAQITLVTGVLASLASGVTSQLVLTTAAVIVVFLTLASFAVYMQLWLAHMTAEDQGP